MKIQLTSLLVQDQAAALAFYVDTLGFEVRQDIPVGEYRWLTVVAPGAPGLELSLEPTAFAAARDYQAALHDEGIAATAFASDALDEEVERLQQKGVVFSMLPTAVGDVRIAVFDDTCGNNIQLYEMP